MERTTDPSRTHPPTPYQVSQVVPKARGTAKILLQQLLKAETVDASKLSFINGFISYICLSHAQRPSLASGMRLEEFQAAQPTKRPDGTVSFTVLVANHKTGSTHTGQISFTKDMYEFIKDYIKLRAKIMAAQGQSCPELLVNGIAKPIQVSELIARLHRKVGLRKGYTSTDARRSMETWCQNLPIKGRVAEYIAHSEMTAKARYTAPGRTKVAEIGYLFEKLQAMTAKVRPNIDHDFPVSVPGVPCTNPPDATAAPTPQAGPSAVECMTTKEQSSPPSTTPVKRKSKLVVKLGKALSRVTGSKGSKQPPESATGQSPSSSTSSSPGKTSFKETVLSLLQTRYWPMSEDTQLPTPREIHAEFPRLKLDNCKQVRDTLNYQKKLLIHERAVDKLLKRESRRQKVAVSKLVVADVDAFIPDATTLQTLSSKVLFPKIFKRLLVSRLSSLQQAAANYIAIDDHEKISQHIDRQSWPNIAVCTTADRGRGVMVSGAWIQKGAVVCDYHGDPVTHEQGEKIRKSLPAEDSNYMYFFIHDSKRPCIDASTVPCSCHPNVPTTFGRLINHSATEPNLKSRKLVLNNRVHLLLTATRDIAPMEELYYDYGVRTVDEGNRLEFLFS